MFCIYTCLSDLWFLIMQKLNESKTEICLFHSNDKPPIQIMLQDVCITSKKTMNVHGVILDSKLTWNAHIASAITKAKKALFALRLLKRFFNFHVMRTLLDSYFYSTLYYNSEYGLPLNSTLI